jgi:glucose-6-phosphate isomerase
MNFRLSLPPDLRTVVDAACTSWQADGIVDRFWQKDAGLWTRDGEEQWMGWIDIVERQQKELAAFAELAGDIQSAKFETALLLGMGGSSLCPEVLAKTFGRQRGFPELRVLDSTDPAQVMAACNEVNLAETLVIMASKSGSTLEPNILKQFFFEEMIRAVGADEAASHFLAITDPGSKIEQAAKLERFRYVFYGDPQIGGRYSALSDFGLVPATVAGLQMDRLLQEAAKAVESARQPVSDNPAVQLGLLLGTAANAGRDKLTFFTSPEIRDLGAWLEQLIAESTGKQAKGIIPVDRENAGAPDVYGDDRVFAYVRLRDSMDTVAQTDLDAKVAALEAAGHPVIRFELANLYEIFGQFFTWEVATAVAGSEMGINPFNQPDVESAKVETRALTAQFESTGKLPERKPLLTEAGIELYATEECAARLKSAAKNPTLIGLLRAHLNQIEPADYFAVLAFLPRFGECESMIQGFRHKVRNRKKVATCVGFGPRFLHSTGQDYKGGPNTGVFLQITASHADDMEVPGHKYSFGTVIDAQAAGDLAVLEQRGRRVLRVHLRGGLMPGLRALNMAVSTALG